MYTGEYKKNYFIIFNIFAVREEITDLETFLDLNNIDFARLDLTTKMIKTILRMQSKCADKIIHEEEQREEENSPEAAIGEVVEDAVEIELSTNPADIYKSITLEKVCIQFDLSGSTHANDEYWI